jgi:hypothetical protein
LSFKNAITATLLIACACGTAWAATLAVEEKTVPVGTPSVTLDLSIVSGESEIAGVQSDLVYPNDLDFVAVTTGPAAMDAGKTVSANEVEPGMLRVLAAGVNLDTIGSGVLATVEFALPASAQDVRYPVEIEGLLMSDPFGSRIAATDEDGAVIVGIDPPPDGTSSGCAGRTGPLEVATDTAVMASLIVGLALSRRRQRA